MWDVCMWRSDEERTELILSGPPLCGSGDPICIVRFM